MCYGLHTLFGGCHGLCGDLLFLLNKVLKILPLLSNYVCKPWLNMMQGLLTSLFVFNMSLAFLEGSFVHRKSEIFIQLTNYS